jgi:hypothetical protein
MGQVLSIKDKQIVFPNGDFYEGEVSNDNPNGKGVLIKKEHGKYIGEFINGKRDGFG